MIELYIKGLVKKIKNDEMSDEEILKIYRTFKKRDLTDAELENAKTIKARIKSGELTEEALVEKAKNWLNK